MRRRRSRRDWVVSAVYIASVIVAFEVSDALGLSWYAVAAFYVVASAAVVVYYRVTR